MTTADIYDDFATQVQQFANAQTPPMTVGYPGVPVDPASQTGPWLEARVFWNDLDDYSMENASRGIDIGFFRVAVCYPKGQGLMPAQTIAEGVRDAFPKGAEFAEALVYRPPSLSGPVEMPTHLEVGVTIRWRRA